MWIIIAMYLLLIPLAAVFLSFKYTSGADNPVTVIFKGASTTVIVTAALIGVTMKGGGVSLYDGLLITGLSLGLVGDIIISASFPGGMTAFALGHLCYIGAMLSITDSHVIAVPIWAVLYLNLYLVYKKSKIKLGKLETPTYIYAAIIMAMLSLSFTVPSLLPAALLFTASDFMLAVLTFGKFSRGWDAICLSCYFLGQSLFAVRVINGI